MSQAVPPAANSAAESSGAFSLANHFLIAMPSMADPSFSGTVIYLCEHDDRGALGLVINRPTDLTLERLFERVDLKLEIAPLADSPVLYGGPVQTERGFVLHDQRNVEYNSTLVVAGGLVLTTSKDVLEAVAGGEGPAHLLVTLGYASWAAGQLEQEISLNAWLTVRADPAIVFDVPHEQRLTAAMHLLGFDPAMLSQQAGHA
jgi:putative transcriptional regulator